MEKIGIGQAVRRSEDVRFLTGAGRYLDDIVLDGMVHGIVVRSPHAHALLARVDTASAAAAPGVLAVLTGADWRAEGLGGIPTRTPVKGSDGSPPATPPRPGLVADRVRFVGDAVAFVVAESIAAARDAAELIEIDYEPLPAVTDAATALAPGAPLVWDDVPGNLCVDYEAGDAAAVDAAFAEAAHTVAFDVYNNRLTAVPIEPRGAIGRYHADTDSFTLISSTQNIHANRNEFAKHVFGIPPDRIRHVAYDVGGGFGGKNGVYPEPAIVLFAARRVGRPVKWINDRSESFLSDTHGRDQRSHVELALDKDGGFLAMRVDSIGDTGAYLASIGPFTSTGGTARTIGGTYRIPALYFHARAVFTNTVPTDPYRGAGRPEATFMIERAIDVAAAELGFDAVELRRRNVIRRTDMPYRTPIGIEIDSGDFEVVLERTLELADWAGFPARAAAARTNGRRRGIGLALYIGLTGGGPNEYASLTCDRDGSLTIAVGSQSTGTGHETVFPQLVADRLGIPIERIGYRQADTDLTPLGGGHGGSRVLETGGSATVQAADKIIAKARLIAGHLLEAAEGDIDFADGRFVVAGTDRSVTMAEVIAAAFDPARLPAGIEPGLEADVTFKRQAATFPNGGYAAEVEVDLETGQVRLVDYTVVNDFGTIINPMTTDGQVMGASAQGIGQALFEHVVYQEGSGQMLSGSLMDYCVPRADDLPDIRTENYEGAPTANNPLGVKGAGEAGCGGAPPALVNAVIDALRDEGVRHIDMPLTPERVWRALNDARRRA